MIQPGARLRLPLLGVALLALLAAIWGGWIRLGWSFPPLQPTLPLSHGPLMVSGFLGTLIALERAVALRQRWTYAAPLFSALGIILFLTNPGWPNPGLGPLLLSLASIGLVAVFGVIVRRQPAPFTFIMAVGSVLWTMGNLLWLSGKPVFQIVMWWAGFLVLTIVGERLELARLMRLGTREENLFLLASAVFLGGLILHMFIPDSGARLAGLGMLALAAWLLRFDIARRTIRKSGLPRFAAICLLSGYLWLAAAGVMSIIFGSVVAGPRYDAVLHSIFLGFVFSMIFGHAPIIFPSLLQLPVEFKPGFYLHLSLLHLSLLIRIYGDLSQNFALRRWGGLLNGIALLLFLISTSITIATSIRISKTGSQDQREIVDDSPISIA